MSLPLGSSNWTFGITWIYNGITLLYCAILNNARVFVVFWILMVSIFFRAVWIMRWMNDCIECCRKLLSGLIYCFVVCDSLRWFILICKLSTPTRKSFFLKYFLSHSLNYFERNFPNYCLASKLATSSYYVLKSSISYLSYPKNNLCSLSCQSLIEGRRQIVLNRAYALCFEGC